MDYSQRRVTDCKGNTRVIFPKPSKDYEEESRLEVLRMELMAAFRSYVKKYCKEGGIQVSNLTVGQNRGLKSLKLRLKNGEIVILPSDKSGRFAIMTMKTYILAGQKHTGKDEEVSDSAKWTCQHAC